MAILLLWLAIIIGFGFVRLFLRKSFGIDQEERAGIPVKKFERWNGWVMMAAILVLIILFADSLEVFLVWVFVIFLIVNAAQIFLEWKYLKGSRKYQASIIYFTITALAIIIFITIARSQTALF